MISGKEIVGEGVNISRWQHIEHNLQPDLVQKPRGMNNHYDKDTCSNAHCSIRKVKMKKKKCMLFYRNSKRISLLYLCSNLVLQLTSCIILNKLLKLLKMSAPFLK